MVHFFPQVSFEFVILNCGSKDHWPAHANVKIKLYRIKWYNNVTITNRSTHWCHLYQDDIDHHFCNLFKNPLSFVSHLHLSHHLLVPLQITNCPAVGASQSKLVFSGIIIKINRWYIEIIELSLIFTLCFLDNFFLRTNLYLLLLVAP